jgi:hypothetical protein
MPREILTRCGYRCDLCLAYKENVEKDDRRNLLSDGWQKYFGFRIEPEDIVCDGCLNDDCIKNRLLDTGCPIRPCVKEKGYENCSQCDEFMCEKFKQRVVDFDEMKKQHGSISRIDYKLFISAYDNKKRVSELKLKNSECSRMLNKEIVPDTTAMSKFIGGECSTIWDGLIDNIRKNYNGFENILYYGKNYGWAFQYKQNKSTTLFTLFPERKAFTVLIVYGKQELERVESSKYELSSKIIEIIRNTKQFHDGKWVSLRICNNLDLRDLCTLMSCKKQPKTKVDFIIKSF